MGAMSRYRSHRSSTGWDQPAAPNLRVQRVEAAAGNTTAVLRGLDPRRLGPVAGARALSDIGAVAGNAAVAGLVGRVRTDFALDPPGGVREIRRVRPGGTLGHTRLSMDPSPPLFRLPSPESTDGGYAVRPSRARASELDFEVRYPTTGRHQLYEGTTAEGAPARIWLDVSSDWAATILKGEEEHVGDQTIAWRDTWQRVADVVNAMADAPPIRGASPEEARRGAWRHFIEALPALLRPEGREPTEESQVAKWGLEGTTSVFRTLIGESKRARDDSQWHTPDASLDHLEGADEVRALGPGSSRIDKTKPEDLMRAAWERLAAASGRGGRRSGGGR